MYGKMKGKIVFADILEHVESLDVKTASHIDGNNLVIAVVTPVAERVHQLVPQSGEIAFMDASGGMDRYGTQVVMIMTHTPLGGGLPLGSIFLTSKKSEHMKKGLTMLSDLLGGNAFYGRGKNGPCVFMTDHCEAERKAIREVYPTSTPLLCAFHILQAFWRFLWDKQSGVEKGDRPHIFNLMKGLLYAESVPQLEDKYNIMQSAIVAQNPAVQDHLTKYWSMKEDWALALRQDMLVRGSNTNNIVECSFRSLTDKILRRQKCYNVVQLLNYTAVFVSKYFCRKLLQLISNPGAAAASSSSRKALMKGAEISSEGITYIEGDTNKILTHYVDTSIGTCTCYFGSSGAACKHQFAVRHHFDAHYAPSMPDLDETEKLRYHDVATGGKEPLTENSKKSQPIECQIQNIPLEDDQSEEVEEVTCVSSSSYSDDRQIKITNFRLKFKNFCSKIEEVVTSDPESLLGPVNTFMDRAEEQLESKTTLASALATFGSVNQMKGRRGLIPVQPTAVARRRSHHITADPTPSGSRNKRKLDLPEEPSVIPLGKR